MKLAIATLLLTFAIFSSIGKCAAAGEGNSPVHPSSPENFENRTLHRSQRTHDLLALRDEQMRSQQQQHQPNQHDPENFNNRVLQRTHRTHDLLALRDEQMRNQQQQHQRNQHDSENFNHPPLQRTHRTHDLFAVIDEQNRKKNPFFGFNFGRKKNQQN